MVIDLSYRDIQGNLQEKQETANCYVISKPGEYCFPLIMGNGIKDGKTNYLSFTNQKLSEKQADFYDYLDKVITSPELSGGDSVSIISWDSSREFIQDLRIEKDYVKFLITNVPETGANYVIGVKDKNGVIMWSWHIWLWKDKLKDVNVGKYKILNTNLASKKLNNKLINWLYQWGRKDPICFFYRTIISKECSKTISQTIRHPRIFYLDNGFSWINNSIYNYWGYFMKQIVGKTIYDPCPLGYHVPTRESFGNLTIDYWDRDKNGWIFNAVSGILTKKLLFPAVANKDDNCCYWTTCILENGQTIRLVFDDGFVNFANPWSLTGGGSVRPMKEEK